MALWYPGRYVREDFERVSGTRSSTSVVKLISYKEGMMMKMKRLVVCALAAAMIGAGALTQVSAFNLGSVLGGVVKVGGIAILVDKYGASINSAINSVMMKEGAGTNYATKVVPIVSIGNKGYIGAAQVIGDADQVEKVKAVGQLEISWNDKLFRIKGLIPMDSVNPTSFSRVQGVGVSAVINVRV